MMINQICVRSGEAIGDLIQFKTETDIHCFLRFHHLYLLFNVQNTVVTCDLEKQPPGYVLDTLSLGPKNATLDRFNPKDILAELDDLLRFCKRNSVLNDTITDINIKTLTYVKKCKKMKTPRHLMLTRKYLNDNKLLAVPFDKGIGFCIMKIDKYQEKLDAILNLSQFE